MKKRIIASILTCAMAASLFIGCGSTGGDTKEGAAVEEAPAAEEGGEESAAPAASNEELSGTLTFAIWEDSSFGIII